jgi:hypothetical protein
MKKSEFGKCRWNPATSGRRCRIPARKFDRIRQKWPDQVISAQIPTVWARSGRNLPDPARSMAGSGRFGQIWQEPTGFRPFWLDPAGLDGIRQYSGRNLVASIRRRWLNTGDRMLSDSGAGWILTIDNCLILTIGCQTCL